MPVSGPTLTNRSMTKCLRVAVHAHTQASPHSSVLFLPFVDTLRRVLTLDLPDHNDTEAVVNLTKVLTQRGEKKKKKKHSRRIAGRRQTPHPTNLRRSPRWVEGGRQHTQRAQSSAPQIASSPTAGPSTSDELYEATKNKILLQYSGVFPASFPATLHICPATGMV